MTLAYSVFALFEWILVFLEAGFDAISIFDFGEFELQVVEKRKIQDDEELSNEEESGAKPPSLLFSSVTDLV